MEQEKVLVTGANGFIGSRLCRALLDKGYFVFGMCYGDQNNVAILEKDKNFKAIRGDVTDFDDMVSIIKKYQPDGVFHTAAILPAADGKDDLFLLFRTNVQGTFNVLEACRTQNVKKFVYSSSMSIYGRNIKYLPVDENHPANPADFYGLTKWQGEELCKLYSLKHGINITILRYGSVYGLGRRGGAVGAFLMAALENKDLNIFSDMTWDIVYVSDIITANINAYANINRAKLEIINIGSGEETDIKDLAQKAVKITGSSSKIILPNKPSAQFRFYFNINKAKELLGLKPLSPDEGLAIYLKEVKSQPFPKK